MNPARARRTEASRGIATTLTGATLYSFTNIFTETTAPASAQVTRQAGQAFSRSCFSRAVSGNVRRARVGHHNHELGHTYHWCEHRLRSHGSRSFSQARLRRLRYHA